MSNSDVFDLRILQNLLDTLGKDQFLPLVSGFLEKSDEITAELSHLKDAQAIHEKAHEMKGMAANFGFAELSAIAKDIEDIGENTDIVQAHIKKLSGANQRAKISIKEWLDQA